MNPLDSPPTTQAQSGNSALTSSEREALKRSFAEDGYFIVKNVVSPALLAELHLNLTTTFNQAQASGGLFSGGGLVSGHLNGFPGAGSRFVYEALEARGIVDLIREIEPKATRLPNIGCNFNLPGSVKQHYHADRDFTKAFMIANVAVIDTVIENGAMELIAGTHRKFYKYWQFALERPYRNSIRVPMQQGDVMVRTSNVWHRGMPNMTAVARPMLALTWEDGGTTHDDPFAVEEGKITFRPNWFRPTRLGRIRERVFVTVPASYSAYRIVSSLVGNKGY